MDPFFGDAWRALNPAPEMGLAEYSVRRIFNEEGRPFDLLAFPHLVAPGGPMDAFDSLRIREIALQWASRLGKTFFVLCGSLYHCELAPCNQMLAGNIEDLALQQTERIRKMGSQIPVLKKAGIENTLQRRLNFGGNTVYAAWARSPVTLSNVNILYGGASELDLWERIKTSKHPDPEDMFRDRFKDNASLRKVVFESIPTLAGTYEDELGNERPRSRIEAKRLQGSDCQFWVGCPHCDHYQVLDIERVSSDGYRCEGCEVLIDDVYRKTFIRSGVWSPRGCGIVSERAKQAAKLRLDTLAELAEFPETDPKASYLRFQIQWNGWENCDYITGKPENDGILATYQLSSLYALSLTWGQIDAEKSDSQNFMNQWLAKTYEPPNEDDYDLETEAATLARTCRSDLPRETVPEWATIVCFTADRQEKTLPWMVSAWDESLDRVHIVAAGEVFDFEGLEIIQGKFDPAFSLIDSGYLSTETYDWCLKRTKQGYQTWPVKGDKASQIQHHYKFREIEDENGRKSTYRGLKRVHINTQSTQEWCNRLLKDGRYLRLWHEQDASDLHWLTVQLLNEREDVKQSSSTWDRITRAFPNDQRDNLRYAFVLAQMVVAAIEQKRTSPKRKYGVLSKK